MCSEMSRATRLILASGSPRRRQLMQALDIHVDTVSPAGDEGAPLAGETPYDYSLRLSQEKAYGAATSAKAKGAVVLAADTSVVLDGDTLGKPTDKAEASRMLKRLRGRAHTVVTGLTAIDSRSGRSQSVAKTTDVTMRNYTDEEVAAYVAAGGPMDKAGAYAIQDEEFRPAKVTVGCYLNVVGLPLCEVFGLLEGLGVRVRLRRGWRPAEQCLDCPLHERLEVDRA